MNLYILGNGYDINKGLKTKYSDFANWVKNYDYQRYLQIKNAFQLNNLWSDLENQMANSFINISRIMNNYNFEKDKVINLEDIIPSNFTFAILLKKWLLETINIKKMNVRENIINFNYTSYITGENIFYIHKNVSSMMSLNFGHSQPRKLEERFLIKKNIFEYGKSYRDPNRSFNQLTKFPEVAKDNLRRWLVGRGKINKLIFFGFSFGKQDAQYFDVFDHKIAVEFYYFNDSKDLKEIKNVVKAKFKNVNFIDSQKWIDFKEYLK